MSCQCTFVPRESPPSREELEAFLADRRWYEDDANGFQYRNTDTGVEFRLDWSCTDEDRVDRLRFEMAYVRPRFFALEAGSELAAIASSFEFVLESPDGEQTTAFETDDFVAGWERGNAEAIASAENLPPFRLSRDRLRDLWRWNRARKDYQAVLGQGVFVPAIRLLVEEGRVERACAWPETIPFALPAAADLVLMAGLEDQQLARQGGDMRVVDREALEELIEEHADTFERRTDPTRHLLIGWTSPPDALLEALPTMGAGADDRELSTLSPGDVLDEESVG